MKRNSIGPRRESVNRALRRLAISMLLLALSTLWLPERAFGGTGSWITLANSNSSGDGIGLLMLLSDGTVLAEGSSSNWWALTPDSTGSYVNGAWSSRHSSTWGHQTGSSAILTNGNVYMGGGENGNGINDVEIYNPVSGSWSIAVNTAYFGGISDGNAMLLPNGEVLIEPQNASGSYNGDTFLFNPGNNTLNQTATAPLHNIAEAAWVKLPNDNVVVIDSDQSSAGATTAETYDPYTQGWSNAVFGGTVPNIWPNVTGTGLVSESGPAFLLPNGNAIFFGGNLVTAIYDNGIWSAGASLNNGEGMKDAPGAMMFNGKILLAVSPQGVNSSKADINGIGPTSFYEYDYTANGGAGGFTLAPSPSGGISGRAQGCTLLDLPDGSVLLSTGGSQLYDYKPDESPLAAGRPAINIVQWNSNGSLHLTGTLFNGISAGAAFGDEEQMDSNFPLVRFTSGSTVYYGFTYNWSSTSVQTGSRIVTTEVNVPAAVLDYPGQWSLQVVANGIASSPVNFYSPVWVNFSYTGGFYFGYYDFPYNTLAEGTNAVASGGTVAIESSGTSSTETMTITRPMTIISVGGPSTIGH